MRDPDADADAVVLLVHEVDVVAAVVRLLGLEEAVRTEHGRLGVARPATDVLGPGVVAVAGPAEPVARVAADEVAAVRPERELPRVRPRHLAADALVELQRGDGTAARAAAAAGRGDPAAGAGAVHEAQVVRLDRRPAAAADRPTATAAATAGAAAR